MSETVERMVPLYEAKMIHHYDHRWATYEPDGSTRDVALEEKQDPEFVSLPRYWVRESVMRDRLEGKWDEDWLLGWRRIARSTDERTFISTVVSDAAFGDSVFLMLPLAEPGMGDALQAALGSFALDFAARQKIGGTNASFFLIEQLPLPQPAQLASPVPWSAGETWGTWLGARSARLRGEFGERRSGLRSEIDGAIFRLYDIGRDDVDYIMETFPIVKRKDVATHGEFRTKRLILEAYDQMGEAMDTGTQYRSPFNDIVAPE
jgi:hypothetical protein